MNVLMLNGSPRKDGNTTLALNELVKVFERENIDVNLMQIGHKPIRGCIACLKCRETGKCVFNDEVNEIAPLFEKADALILATPVYYASANATLVALLDRLFYSTSFDKRMKVGASIAVARRAGISTTMDELNKYFSISGMPIASSQYWNDLHGSKKGEGEQDLEGLQTMRVLAENIVFLLRSIALGKEKYGLPEREEKIFTNFVR